MSAQKQLLDKNRLKYLKMEEKLFHVADMSAHIKSGDLFVSDDEFIHYTTISECERTPNNVLVMIHGFGGFNAIFFKLIGFLAAHFYIIMLDLPGMGFSSRPNKMPFSDTDTSISYFTDRMQKFIEVSNIDKFSLFGHSIGAFLAAHLFDRMPDQIINLYLVSPAGFNLFDQEWYDKRVGQIIKGAPFFKRYLITKFANRIFVDKKSPFDAFWLPGSIKEILVDKYFSSGRFSFTVEEAKLITDIQKYFISQPQYAERCLGYLLHLCIQSQRPIIDILKRHKDRAPSVHIFFGEYDWMDKNETKEIIEQLKLGIDIILISRSEHQLIIQNPHDLTSEVIRIHDRTFPRNKEVELRELKKNSSL